MEQRRTSLWSRSALVPHQLGPRSGLNGFKLLQEDGRHGKQDEFFQHLDFFFGADNDTDEKLEY
jgi:hypothetical protein